MRLLAIETATEACSVAVHHDGNVEERFEVVHQQHSARILPMVQQALAASGLVLSQLDAIAFSRGPGSFTGLRIGAGVAQGLAFGADLPVVPISSLAALAQGQDAPRVFAALDARMAQVYYGAYERHGAQVTPVGVEAVAFPEAVALPEAIGWIGVGSGFDQYEQALRARLGRTLTGVKRNIYPHARDVATLASAAVARGETLPAEQAVPVYIRDDVAKKSAR